MQGKLAFGRRKHDEVHRELPMPSKPKKKREEGEKTCRAGACAYAAVVEASTFRAEATRKVRAKQKAAGAWASSNLDTSLYDSFELDSFSSQLGHCLAEERRHTHVAHQKSDLASSWRPRSHVLPRWQSRRLSISCCFPSCFPKRPPTIQLGKRKKPSLHSALHVIAKVARRGCHVIAALPACAAHDGGNVKQPQKLQQTHHHYHHHLHHYTLERPREAQKLNDSTRGGGDGDHKDCDGVRYDAHVSEGMCDGNGNRSSEDLHPHLPTAFLSPLHTLPYLPLKDLDPHLTSIKYHS